MKSFYEMGMSPTQKSGAGPGSGSNMKERTAVSIETLKESNTEKSMVTPSMPHKENGTTETALQTRPINTPAGLSESPTGDLKPLSEVLRTGVLTTMNIADDSMRELLSRAKGMFANAPEADVRTLDPDRVTTAALCGRTIAEIMKAKVEAMKLLSDNER